MNNSLSFIKVLSGISKTLNIANQVIPIYRDTKPLFKNIKNIYTAFNKNKVTPKTINEKKIITKSDNNPQFFI